MDKDYINEKEEVAIRAFLLNKDMYNAVKKVLLATIYHQGKIETGKMPTDFNFAFNITAEIDMKGNVVPPKSDEQIGQELRACNKALGFLKSGFDRLLEFLPAQPNPEKKGNPAR